VRPHQEIYLAALDHISSDQIAELATLMQDGSFADAARNTSSHIGTSIAQYKLQDGYYAFSRNRGGSYDNTATVFPAAAMWTDAKYLPQPDASLGSWAGFRFSADWGLRSVAEDERVYDPISYHQGTVWPLFTGWAAMAEYRGGKPMAGYAALMRNVDLTWQQDPGFVTEVISGRFFQPLGRSSSHQLWSSAMTFSPALRGLFGIEADALHRGLQIHPQLPAAWNGAEIDNVRVGDDLYHVSLMRTGTKLIATASSEKESVLCLNATGNAACSTRAAREHRVELALPPVEIGLPDQELPEPGSITAQPRVVSETYAADHVSVMVEGMAGTTVDFVIRHNTESVRIEAEGGEMVDRKTLRVKLPQTSGAIQKSLTIRWR
jgi:hypothetical protein